MAFEHGFFNAVYDDERLNFFPRYDAEDFARRFALYFTDGVFYNASTALQVSAKGGLKIAVNSGACNIRGYYGVNTAVEEITLSAADAFLPRIDAVCVRLDIPNKTVDLHVIKGTAATVPATPTADSLTRSGEIYDLMLAYVYIPAGATQITNANITDTRGDDRVCGFVAGTVNQLSTSSFWAQWQAAFSQYAADQETEFNEWWNGIKDTLATIDASALVVRQDDLEAKVNKIFDVQYHCNGSTDNIELTNLISSLQASGTYGETNVYVHGDFGATDPAGGEGTATNWYKWLILGRTDNPGSLRINLDFTNVRSFTVPVIPGKYNTIISGGDVHIKGLTVVINEATAGTAVRIFDNTRLPLHCEKSRFWITANKESYIARTGTFIDCRGSVANAIGNSFCFSTYDAALLRIDRGEYYAYTGDSAALSAVVGQISGAGVSLLYAVNAPTVARGGFTQTHAIYISTGVSSCTDLVTTLPLVATGANVRGTIALNRPNML